MENRVNDTNVSCHLNDSLPHWEAVLNHFSNTFQLISNLHKQTLKFMSQATVDSLCVLTAYHNVNEHLRSLMTNDSDVPRLSTSTSVCRSVILKAEYPPVLSLIQFEEVDRFVRVGLLRHMSSWPLIFGSGGSFNKVCT